MLVSGETVKLPEIFNPSSITINDQYIYVVQDVKVFVYSLNNFQLITQFGKAGEGPREFIKIPQPWLPSITIYIKGESLVINSMNKLSLYSKKGNFIKELKSQGFVRYIPCSDKYIMMEYSSEEGANVVLASLVDSGLKNKKRVCRVKFPEQRGQKRNPILMAKMTTYFDRFCYEGKFVIPLEEGTIKIFDDQGKELSSFTPPYTRVKVTAAKARELDDFFSNDVRYKRPYSVDKSRNLITFGDHLPLFNYYRLDDGKVYIISNFKKENKYETFIYSFSGKLLKKTFIPLVDQDLFNVNPFCIKNGKIYQLIEDEESVILKITKII
jgi:hypothetical protein